MKTPFYKTCWDLRHNNPEGEKFWQTMMRNKVETNEEFFLEECDPEGVLDEDETWESYKEAHSDMEFYWSSNAFFFQTRGFEYIFKHEEIADVR